MNDNSGIRQRKPLALGPGRQQDRLHRGRLADADGLDVRFDELHGVVDGQPCSNRAARAVDIELDVLVGVLGLEEEHLGDRQVRYLIVNRRADEDDAVLEQARKDVVGALAPVGLLDHHRNQLILCIKRMSHKEIKLMVCRGMREKGVLPASSYESPVIVAWARTKSTDFSRRKPA